MAETNPKNNNIKREAAALEEEILQSRERIAELDKLMAAADEAEITRLKQKLDYENLVLEKKKEALDAAKEQIESERKITEAAKDSAEALEKFLDNSSIAQNISDELSTKYSSIANKASELASLAGDNAQQVKSVAEFNNQIYQIESVREKILNSINEGDKEEQITQQEKLQSLTAGLQTIIANGNYTAEQIKLMDKMLGIQKDVTNELRITMLLTKEEKAQYTKLIEQAEEFKTKIKAIKDMASVFLKSPSTILGGMVIGAGFLAEKFGDVNKELGIGYGSMNGFSASAGVMSFFFEDAADTAKELAHHLGNSKEVTLGMQASTGIMASNLGISGTEAAELASQFGHLRGQTHDQAMDMMASAKATALARGVVPNDLMKDLAQNTEMFSKYAKGGGENIIAAGVAARQLGIDMKTLNTMAESLMDFETSIEKELEASAMLGRDLNFQRARELIYAGDLESAQKEIIAQLGTKAQWDKMDLYQKKAAADALGIQVTELEKIYKGQENLAGASGVVADKFSWLAETSSFIANEWGGGILKGIGGAVMMMGQFGKGVSDTKDGIKAAKEGMSSISGLWQKFKGFIMPSPVTEATGAIGGPLADAAKNAGGGLIEEGVSAVGDKLKEEASETIVDQGVSSVGEKLQDKASEKIEGVVDDKIESITSPEGIEQATEAVNEEKTMGEKLKDLAAGLKEMGNGKVLFGALNLIPTGLGFLALTPGIPSLFALSKIDLSKLGNGMMNMAIGLGFMGTGKVAVGSLNLILAGLGFTALMPGIPSMFLLSKVDLNKLGMGMMNMAIGLGFMGTAKVALGSLNLILAGIGFLAMTPGIIGMYLLSRVSGPSLQLGLQSLGIGLGFMAGGNVAMGSLNLILAGIGFLAMTPGIIGMFLLSKVSGPSLQLGLQSLGMGLGFMSGANVAMGSLNLILAGIGFLAITPGILGMFLLSKVAGPSLQMGLQSLGMGLGFMAGGNVALGALNLILVGAGFALVSVGVIGMAAIALLGAPAAAGLIALGNAFNAINPASMFMGALGIAALGVSLIPFAYAMSLMSGVDIGSILSVAAGLVLFGAAAVGLGMIAPLVLMGSVALAALGLALIPFSSAMANLGGVNLESALMLSASILPLALSVAAVGFLSAGILLGTGVLQILGMGLIPFAKSLSELPGVNVESALALSKSILPLALSVAAVGILSPAIVLGSFALKDLSSGLMQFGTSMAQLGGTSVESALSLAKSILPLALSVAAIGILSPAIVLGSFALKALSSGLIPFNASMTQLDGTSVESALSLAKSILPLALSVAAVGILSPAIVLGSFALKALSSGLIPFSTSMTQLDGISLESALSLAKSILPLALSVAAVGILAPAIVLGAFALKTLSSGLIPFGEALASLSGGLTDSANISSSIIALGTASAYMGLISPLVIAGSYAIDVLSKSLQSLSSASGIISAMDLTTKLSELSTINYLPILGLATALTTLSGALMAVGIAGILALPALAGLSMFGEKTGLMGTGGKNKGGENDELLNEIRGLRSDLNNGKVAVYMDGQRVTAAVAAANARSPLTVK